MPLYEYVCQTCGKRFELLQSITQPPLETCPVDICEHPPKGHGQVRRLLSRNVGLVFNGSGFYITDYARKGDTKASTTESAPVDTPTPASSGE
ncbi:MAG: zinc ribbon domain-containing protein [Candidatus Kapabacteria bacterium]|nr:zinc ribbon domain-containing protein [Candidatus Kapabacteria bacterium]MCS7169941.1 zinc ribbon domain-containing protein [Candidatus Kapabacteria bacterium]MDW7996380.1 FmdB family zinc ribbon protein [Bacteroidota bacterium]MDW8225991.1 FmdB family zinc ribbon protein [Bacteroidota bacterium]